MKKQEKKTNEVAIKKVSCIREQIKKQIESRRQKFTFEKVTEETMNEIKTKYGALSQEFRKFREMKVEKLKQIKDQRKHQKQLIKNRRQKFSSQKVKAEEMNKIKEKYEKRSQQFREFREIKIKKLTKVKNQRKHEKQLIKNRQQKFAKQEVDVEKIRAKYVMESKKFRSFRRAELKRFLNKDEDAKFEEPKTKAQKRKASAEKAGERMTKKQKTE